MNNHVTDPGAANPQQLVLGVIRLIERKVTELAPWARGADRADLVGAARLGASLAASRFNGVRYTRFSSYATPYICGAIKDHLKAERRQHGGSFHAGSLAGRELVAELPDTFNILWDDVATNRARLERLAEHLLAGMVTGIAAASLADPEAQLVHQDLSVQLVVALREALAKSPPIEQRIYALRYEQQYTLVAIAQELTVDERTVRRHHEALLDRLHAYLYGAGITGMPEND